MAIQLKSIDKRKDSLYIVTVEDTSQIIGRDESGGNIYRTYTVRYNPANGRTSLRNSIVNTIRAEKAREQDVSSIESDIKTTVEAIDASVIAVSR